MILKAPRFWQVGGRYHPAALALWPLSVLWRVAGWMRGAFARPFKADIPVICVGNITAGGTGKTPCAIALAALYADKKVCFLTRGFGGSHQGTTLIEKADDSALFGDEAIILSRHAPTIISADRVAGLKLAASAGFDLVIADDGLQNPHFHKDVRIAVIDGGVGFGNGRIIPAGPLREGVGALKHAHAVLIVGDDMHGVATQIPCPVLRGRVVPDERAPDISRPYVAFAGIGRPEKFFATLKHAGYTVLETISYGDHYNFTPADMQHLRGLARKYGAGLITTEKDFARLPLPMRAGISMLKVHMVIEGDLEVIKPNV